MNLVLAIKQIEQKLKRKEYNFNKEIQELKDGLAVLRKLNTICEKCEGTGKYLRIRTSAEDARVEPNNPGDYPDCEACERTGKISTDKNHLTVWWK